MKTSQGFLIGILFSTGLDKLGWLRFQIWEPLVHGTASGVMMLCCAAILLVLTWLSEREEGR